MSTSTKVLAVVIPVAALIALCCGGLVVLAVVGDNKPKVVTVPVSPTPAPAPVTHAPSTFPSASPSPSPVPVKMPNVVGQNGAIAEDILKKAGFTNVTLGSADPDDTLVILPENWKIVEQSAIPGETVQSDTLIVLSCTKKR